MQRHLQVLRSAVLVSLLASNALATIISTFSDHTCKDSLDELDGPDGYPNGECSQLRSQGLFGSFQLMQLDNGCGVTIYHKNSIPGSPCSDEAPILAEIGVCYNSSWIYYSIDNCVRPSPSATRSSTSTATGTSSSSSSLGSTATATHAGAAMSTANAASASASASDSASYDSYDEKKSTNVGAVVGGIVGGVVGLALIGLAAWFLWLRNGRSRAAARIPSPPADYFYKDATTGGGYDDFGKVAVGAKHFPQAHELQTSANSVEMPSAGSSNMYEMSTTETKYYAELPGHGQ